MNKLAEKVGTIVKNDGRELSEKLGLENLRHTGNYIFSATYKGQSVAIETLPQDDDGDYIKVISIVDMDASCKVHITYKMLRKNEVAETCIDLPISQARYRQLKEGVSTQNKVWKEVREALVQLTILQGYDELGEWGIELEI